MDRNDLFFEQLNQRKLSAYKTLYEEYYRVLVMYAINFVGRQQVAEDIVQELFVTIWKKQITFLSFTSLRVYLYNAVRNASFDYLKHQNVEKSYIVSLQESYHEVNESQDLQEEEIRRLLYWEIDNLPPKMREIFLLYMEGKKNEEIAKLLNVSLETVKTQKKRAVKQIKSKLGPLYCFLGIFKLLP